MSLSLLFTDSTAGFGDTTLSRETGGIGLAVRLEGMVMMMSDIMVMMMSDMIVL